jgi:hypothetical protein
VITNKATAIVATALSVAGVLAATSAPAAAGGAVTYYAAPNGSGTACSASAPCSITQAQASVRSRLTSTLDADLHVELDGGVYRLAQPLQFTANDSGRDGHKVIWQAQSLADPPVLTGAIRVTGWDPGNVDQNGVWRVPLPAGADPKARQLTVDHVRGLLAQRHVTSSSYATTNYGYLASSNNFADVADPAGVVVAMNARWKSQRCPVTSVSTSGGNTAIHLAQPCWDDARIQGSSFTGASWLEGAPAFIDTPGEFAIDAGWLYYKPRAGQDMTSADVELPVLQNLLTDDTSAGAPWHDVTFNGITFTGTTWTEPSIDGFDQMQADAEIDQTAVPPAGMTDQDGQYTRFYWYQQLGAKLTPAAVQLTYAAHIAFNGDTFTDLGDTAVAFGLGVQSSAVTNSSVTDSAAGGLRVGDVTPEAHHPSDPATMTTEANTLSDNVIKNVGLDYQGAVGIMLGYTADSVVDHNTIADLPYTGISTGWGWSVADLHVAGQNPGKTSVYPYLGANYPGAGPTIAQNNQITNNLVENVMTIRSDGGAIYSLGSQPGSVISGNYLYNNVATNSRALYLDEGSAGETWTGNVIDTAPVWVNLHQTWPSGVDPGDAVTGNYTNVSTVGTGAHAYAGDVYGNTVVTNGQWPTAAQDVIQTAGAPTPPLGDLSALYDTVCVTDDANVAPGNCDGQGSSYSAQALAAKGVTPGSTVSVDGLDFTWPDVPAGQVDAVSTPGTQIPLSGTFDQIGLLFSSMAGSYTFTFDYADGSTSTQTVSLPGWVNSSATSDTTLVDQFAYRNRPNGQDTQYHPDLFLLVLQPQAKPLAALVLPTTGRVDLFALAN